MNIEPKYQLLLSQVASILKNYNFKKNSSTFYYQNNNGNWGIINFQKSMKSTSGEILFTINVGVVSARLLNFFSVKPSKKRPNIWDCHWRIRLGQLIEGKDKWWLIDFETSIEELGENITTYLLSLAIPGIEKYIEDNELRDLWLSGKSPSLTEFQRLLHLSVLLREIGPQELLEPTLYKLQQISVGKSTALTADIYINKLMKK